MQSVISIGQPLEEVLMRDKDVTITSSRAEIKKITFSIRYLSKIEHSDTTPRRVWAVVVLALLAFAVVLEVIMLASGIVTISWFVPSFFVLMLVTGIPAYILWRDRPQYCLTLSMVDGQNINYSDPSELHIHRIYNALTAAIALNQQDPRVTTHI